jgi:hypothetical protein
MNKLILLLPLLLVSCDQDIKPNADMIKLQAQMQSIADERAAEQAARDAIEAKEAAQRAAIAAEEKAQIARQIQEFQTWRPSQGSEKGLTIMSLNQDASGNYLVLAYIVEEGVSYTGLVIQGKGGHTPFTRDQMVAFEFDKVNRMSIPMRVTQDGSIFAIGAEPRKALRGARDLKVFVIHPVTGERNVFSFDVRDFPATYFLIKA